jgi:hypothetical protein
VTRDEQNWASACDHGHCWPTWRPPWPRFCQSIAVALVQHWSRGRIKMLPVASSQTISAIMHLKRVSEHTSESASLSASPTLPSPERIKFTAVYESVDHDAPDPALSCSTPSHSSLADVSLTSCATFQDGRLSQLRFEAYDRRSP